jgi:hypothetical protein
MITVKDIVMGDLQWTRLLGYLFEIRYLTNSIDISSLSIYVLLLLQGAKT